MPRIRQQGRHTHPTGLLAAHVGEPRHRHRRGPAQPPAPGRHRGRKERNRLQRRVVPVSLPIVTGPTGGSLSSSCSAVENDGVFSFGDCSLSAVGTYTLQATDTDGFSTSSPAPAHLHRLCCSSRYNGSTSSPAAVSGRAGKTAVLGKFTVTQEDYQGTPVNAGAGGTTVQPVLDLLRHLQISNTTQNAARSPEPHRCDVGRDPERELFGELLRRRHQVRHADDPGELDRSPRCHGGRDDHGRGCPAQVAITRPRARPVHRARPTSRSALQLQDSFGNNTVAGAAGGPSPGRAEPQLELDEGVLL